MELAIWPREAAVHGKAGQLAGLVPFVFSVTPTKATAVHHCPRPPLQSWSLVSDWSLVGGGRFGSLDIGSQLTAMLLIKAEVRTPPFGSSF